MNTPYESGNNQDNGTKPFSHEEIADRAREIWRSSGMPADRDEEFWLQAEKEIQSGRGRSTSNDQNAQGRIVERDDAGQSGSRISTAAPKSEPAGSSPNTRSRDASEGPPVRSGVSSRDAKRRQ